MTRLAASVIPSVLIAVAITPYALTLWLGDAPTSVENLLPPILARAWSLTLILGAVAIIVGAITRRASEIRTALTGLAVEATSQFLVGGMIVVYAVATYGRFGWAGWSTIFSLLALAAVFLCSWAVTMGDLREARNIGEPPCPPET